MFTDPVAQVIFFNKDSGKEWAFSAPEYPFLTGVQLGYEFARKAVLQITVEAPYEEAITKLLIKDSPFAQGNLVRARIGYASKADWWTAWFTGFLMAGGDGLSIDPNGLSGTITVQATSEAADYQLSKDRLPLTGTPIDVLKQIAEVMGLKLQISLGMMDAAQAVMKDAIREGGFCPTGYAGFTAWEALKALAVDLNMRVCIAPDPNNLGGGNCLWMGTEREISGGVLSKLGPDKKPTFRMRGAIDVATATFPCLTWAPEGAGAMAWLAGDMDQAGKGVEFSYIDSDTGEIKTEKALPKDRQVSTAGGVATPGQEDHKDVDADGNEVKGDEKKQDGSEAVKHSAPVPAGEVGKQRAKTAAERRRDAGSPSQAGVITSIGVPWVVPGNELVYLRGCGDLYDGPYIVDKATHTWGPGTYDMSLTCRRQGTGGVDKVGEKAQTAAGTMPEK